MKLRPQDICALRKSTLERRFEKIIVNEPSRDETIEILKGIRPKWEDHFSRKITDKALESSIIGTLEYTEEAEKCIAQKGYSLEYGVRELRRTVEKLVQIPLSNLMLSGKLKEHKEWQVVCINDEISLVPQS
jgi:ATP-dependent Clp protease ATP-binding subunit ClpA